MADYTTVFRAECHCGWDGPWDSSARSVERDAFRHRFSNRSHDFRDTRVRTAFIEEAK